MVTIKRASWVVLFLILTSARPVFSGSPDFSVDIRLSVPHGLWIFAETFVDQRNRSRTLFERYEDEVAKDTVARKAIQDFKFAYAQLSGSLDFQGFPSTRKQGSGVDDLFIIQSVLARDLTDFKSRTLGLTSLETHSLLFGSLKRLEPFYLKRVWSPEIQHLTHKKKFLSSALRKPEILKFLEKVKAFYQSRWPEGVPFVVSLYPIPAKSGHSSAQSLGAVESVGVLTRSSDQIGDLGVVIHELCHSFYEAQPVELQRALEEHFGKQSSLYRSQARAYLNEGLATAIGNGLAEAMLQKKSVADLQLPGSGPWYNEEKIDGFGKGLAPLVAERFEKKLPIDPAFLTQAISVFEKRFPQAPFEVDTKFNRFTMSFDGASFEYAPVKRSMNGLFKVNSRSVTGALDSPEGIKEIEDSLETVVVFGQLSKVERVAELLRQAKIYEPFSKALTSGWDSTERLVVLWVVDARQRDLFVILAADQADADRSFLELKKLKLLDPQKLRQI